MTNFPQSSYTNFAIVDLNPQLYLLNNLWGAGPSITIEQSITASGPNSWSTIWDIKRTEEWQVTTYTAAINGWHWGWRGPINSVQIYDRKKIQTDVGFQLINDPIRPSRFDVAYDLWLHDNKNGDGDKKHEIMIWLSYSRDLGVLETVHANPTIAGYKWKIWRHPATATIHPVTVFAVDGPDITNFSANITDFIDYLVLNFDLPPKWWLTGIEFGPEIYKGKGILDVSTCSIVR